MVIRGDLLSVDLSNVFQMLAMNRKKGIFRVLNRENILEKRSLYLDADKVGLLEVPRNPDLAAILVDLGIIGYADWQEAHRKAETFAVPPSDYILKRGKVSEEDLLKAETRLQEELILEIFLWKNITFSLDEETFAPEDPRRRMFVVDHMVMEAARRQDEWMRVVELIGGGHEVWRARTGTDPSAAGLTPVHRIVLDYLDGVHGSREVMAATGLPRYLVDTAIAELAQQGLVERMGLNDLIETGDRLAQTGRHADAIRLYKCAVRQDRLSIALHKRLAASYLAEGRMAKAAAHYKFCAMTLIESGLVREALTIYEFVVSILPTDFRSIVKGIELIAKLGGATTDDDRNCLRDGVRLARFYQDTGMYTEAIGLLEHILAVDSGNTSFGFMLARLQTKVGDIQAAVTTYMKLAARLVEQRDYEGALNVYKMVSSFETPHRELCRRRIQEIISLLDRRHRRRVAGFGALIVILLLTAGGVGYWFYQRAAEEELAAVTLAWDEADGEEHWTDLSNRLEELAGRFPLTAAANQARDLQLQARSRVESLRRRRQQAREAERDRRLGLLNEAAALFEDGLSQQSERKMREALESYRACLDKAKEAGQEAWAENPERAVSARCKEIEAHLAREEETLAKIADLRARGELEQAFEVARNLLDPSGGGLDLGAMKVVSRSAEEGLVFSFVVASAPAGAEFEVDDETLEAPALIELSRSRPKVRIRAHAEGYQNATLELDWKRSAHRQMIVLRKNPVRSIEVGAPLAALFSHGADLVAVGLNGVVYFVDASGETQKIIEPAHLVSLSTDPVLEDGKLVFGTADRRVRCIDLAGRRLLWTASARAESVRVVTLRGGVVVSGGASGNRGWLEFFDAETGVQKGRTELASPIRAAAPLNRFVGAVTDAGELVFVDPDTQAVVERRVGPFRRALAPIGLNEVVAVLEDSAALGFKVKNGKVTSTKVVLPSGVVAGPKAVGGQAVMFLEDGTLIVIGADARARIHHETAAASMSKLSPALLPLGRDQVFVMPKNDSSLIRVDVSRGRTLDGFDLAGEEFGAATRWGKWIAVADGDPRGRVRLYRD